MIGKLTGIIDKTTENAVILDVGGVGYVVFASARTLSRIGGAGDRASLLIDTHVREDHIHLYGFADNAEQQWFRLLTSVQGVGAKSGLAILSACPPEKLALAIAAQDKAMLTQADGVGPKLALRILTELKDKAAKIDISGAALAGKAKKSGGGDTGSDVPDLSGDAVSALVNLGYARGDAFAAVAKAAPNAPAGDLQSLIRLALKALSG